MNAASILTFHDSVELFLYLACSELKINISKDIKFMEYWDKLQNLPDGTGLAYKSEMNNLNTFRVNLKHQGVNPPESEIEAARVNVSNFFNKYTPIIFGVYFDKISMADMVQYEPAREDLKQASTHMEQGNIRDALNRIAIAFDRIIVDYEERKQSVYGKSVFHFGLRDPHSIHFSADDGTREYVNKSIEPLQKVVKLMGLGLDLRRYVKFSLLVPEVARFSNGEYIDTRQSSSRTMEDCQFCYDFVIDSAFRTQEFDFDIEKL
jgi:hypothetical protein